MDRKKERETERQLEGEGIEREGERLRERIRGKKGGRGYTSIITQIINFSIILSFLFFSELQFSALLILLFGESTFLSDSMY